MDALCPVMIDFPDIPREIAVLLEILRESDGIRTNLAKMGFEIPDPKRVWSESGHDRGAGWIADRLLAFGVGEHAGPSRESIKVRSQGKRFDTQVVGSDEKDVGSWCGVKAP